MRFFPSSSHHKYTLSKRKRRMLWTVTNLKAKTQVGIFNVLENAYIFRLFQKRPSFRTEFLCMEVTISGNAIGQIIGFSHSESLLVIYFFVMVCVCAIKAGFSPLATALTQHSFFVLFFPERHTFVWKWSFIRHLYLWLKYIFV